MRLPWEGRSRANLAARLALLAFALTALAFLPEFYDHTRGHFTGSIAAGMITERWHVVALNAAAFTAFLVPLAYRRRVDWREYGVVAAFFVSLFVEMYGVPLLVVFASRHLGGAAYEPPETATTVEFLGVEFGFTVPMVYGTVMILAGTVLVVWGWVALYRGLKERELVTGGIYSVSRNPQYLGFILVLLGWLVGWPTVLTVIFVPVLVAMYVRLCYVEEREVGNLPGYAGYRRDVPLVI